MGTWYVAGIPYSSNELYHHGIKGQKWGVRRFQNPDGTRTAAGKERYATKQTKEELKYVKRSAKNSNWGRFMSRDLAEKTGRVNKKVRTSDLIRTRQKMYDAYGELSKEKRDLWNAEVAKKRGELKSNKAFEEWSNSENYRGENVYDQFFNRSDVKEKIRPLQENYDILERAYKSKKTDMAKELVGSYGNKKIKDLTHRVTVQKVYEDAIEFAVTNAKAEDDYRRIFKTY